MTYSYDSNNERPKFNIKKPVELDKEYEAIIEEVSRKGDGVAKIEGFVIFIANTKKGEKVKFKITRIGSRFAIGELIQT
jgi:predicted RNA-binding protein with TRAM domain